MKNFIFLLVCFLSLVACTSCNKNETMKPDPVITTGGPGTEAKPWFPVVESMLQNELQELAGREGHTLCLQDETPLYSGNFMWTKPHLYFGYVSQITPDWKEVHMKWIPHCTDSPATQDILEITFRDSVRHFYQDGTSPDWVDGVCP